jgi:hypothetical protein
MKNSLCLICCAAAAYAAPVYFEPAGKHWLAHAGGREVRLGPGGALQFPGARAVAAVPLDPLPGKVNRLAGRDPRAWRRNIPIFARLRYPSLYPGIDLVYYSGAGELECDFVVAPHADPRSIAIAVRGAAFPSLTPAGDLEAAGLRLRRPRIFQLVDGREREIAGAFVLEGGAARFRIAAYDRTLPLVIDPVVQFSTYFAGPADAPIQSIGADAAGNLYLAGQARTAQSTGIMYVAKLDPSGSNMLYSTYVGGKSGRDVVRSLAVDAQGDVFLTGTTNSADFPLVKPLQKASGGAGDAFLLELDPTGAQILYSTYLGGSADDDGVAVALDAQGNAYVTGRTESINFPTTPRVLSRSLHGAVGSFVTKIKPDGSAPIYSTYLGGSSYDVASALAVDGAGNAFVLVYAASADFPGLRVPPGTFSGATVVTRLDPNAAAVIYTVSTGTGNVANAVAVDTSGNAWIAGSSTSVRVPVTASAVQRAPGGDVYFRSLDGGRTFTPATGSINTGAVNSIGNSPASPGTLYAATGTASTAVLTTARRGASSPGRWAWVRWRLTRWRSIR